MSDEMKVDRFARRPLGVPAPSGRVRQAVARTRSPSASARRARRLPASHRASPRTGRGEPPLTPPASSTGRAPPRLADLRARRLEGLAAGAACGRQRSDGRPPPCSFADMQPWRAQQRSPADAQLLRGRREQHAQSTCSRGRRRDARPGGVAAAYAPDPGCRPAARSPRARGVGGPRRPTRRRRRRGGVLATDTWLSMARRTRPLVEAPSARTPSTVRWCVECPRRRRPACLPATAAGISAEVIDGPERQSGRCGEPVAHQKGVRPGCSSGRSRGRDRRRGSRPRHQRIVDVLARASAVRRASCATALAADGIVSPRTTLSRDLEDWGIQVARRFGRLVYAVRARWRPQRPPGARTTRRRADGRLPGSPRSARLRRRPTGRWSAARRRAQRTSSPRRRPRDLAGVMGCIASTTHPALCARLQRPGAGRAPLAREPRTRPRRPTHRPS